MERAEVRRALKFEVFSLQTTRVMAGSGYGWWSYEIGVEGHRAQLERQLQG
jgi:hypothetical protein